MINIIASNIDNYADENLHEGVNGSQLKKTEITMSKGQDKKKSTKKEPAKSLKEKQADKRDKKNEGKNPGLVKK